jgi:hypothetical protein
MSSQTIPNTDNICFFQSAKTGKPIIIVNDSLVYKGELKNPNILKHSDFPETLNRYVYHFNINNRTYLVHEGCGPVLEYRNDSIVRIDHSFLQKNQFDASPFVYNNQICLFGGYGLFSFKNMITYYKFKSNEWFRLYDKNGEKPHERSKPLTFYNNKELYLLGGWTDNCEISYSNVKDQQIWKFDYSTLQWQAKGKFNDLLKNIDLEKDFIFQTNTKLYGITSEFIIEIDFSGNTITWYKNNELISIKNIVYDKKTDSIFYLVNLPAQNEKKISSIKLSELLKTQIKTEQLYSTPWQEYISHLIWILLTLLLTYVVYKLIVRPKKNCFVYNQSKNKVYYKSKIISNLNPLEEKIIIYLFLNNKDFIQLNQLNSFFEKESTENFSNIIKKRDLTFASLLLKLNTIAGQKEKPLLLIQKNKIDKRIKEIRLNPLYFSIK